MVAPSPEFEKVELRTRGAPTTIRDVAVLSPQ
jgi:hypothetical protein